MRAAGFHRLPRHGPAVLAPNHGSWLDIPAVAAACRRPVLFAASPSLYNVESCVRMLHRAASRIGDGGLADAALRLFDRGLARFLGDMALSCGAFPADLDAGFVRSLSGAASTGRLVCIFPEGRLSPREGLNTFRRGLAWGVLAVGRELGFDVPVYPLAIRRSAAPLGGRWRMSLSLAEPLFYSEVCRGLAPRAGVCRFTDRIRADVAGMLG
jgi:1-acyl-sn-glycerol-3-phosphate acyltransferase